MYTYHLLINKTASGKKLFFKYGNSKNISLQVGKQCAGIEKQFPKDYRPLLSQDKCFLLNMLKEGMKRVALVHILKTHEPLRVYKVTLSISDNKGLIEERDLTAKLKLYSMITERLIRPIDASWKESEVLQRILNYQKSKEALSREVSSLYAYLYSKTKNYETERFSYL